MSWDRYLGISPANIYLFKESSRNTRKKVWKLTIKTVEWRHWRRSPVFTINFEHISHFSGVCIVEFEQVIVGWFIWLKSFIFRLHYLWIKYVEKKRVMKWELQRATGDLYDRDPEI